jgi:branched-subunit amino acid aminotransferase/4-amino-4-deoxychorismate lyase
VDGLWLDGEWLADPAAAALNQTQLFSLGRGARVLLRGHEGRIYLLTEALEHLRTSATLFGSALAVDEEEVAQRLGETIAHEVGPRRLELLCYLSSAEPYEGSVETIGLGFSDVGRWSESNAPINVKVSESRFNSSSPVSRLSPLSLLEQTLWHREASERAADDVLLLNENGVPVIFGTGSLLWYDDNSWKILPASIATPTNLGGNILATLLGAKSLLPNIQQLQSADLVVRIECSGTTTVVKTLEEQDLRTPPNNLRLQLSAAVNSIPYRAVRVSTA